MGEQIGTGYNYSFKEGDTVKIPYDLTTDPINKQGEEGIIKIITDGIFYVLFDDGLVGAYDMDIFSNIGLGEASK
jgi:hypothetical protein